MENYTVYKLETSTKVLLLIIAVALTVLAATQVFPIRSAIAAAMNIYGDVSMRCDGNMRIIGNTIHPDLICRGSWEGTGQSN